MSEINANIVVEQNNLNITPTTNQLNITPEAIQLNIMTGGSGGSGTSNNGELLYNNVNVIGGVANTSYANGNLSLGNVANVKISGGTNGYVLQTDGAGNLSWAVGTGNVSGNGVPGGAVNQIQYNLDGANFGGSTGFTFDPTSNLVSMPGNLTVVGDIVGNVQTAVLANTVNDANQPNITSTGTLTSLTVNGLSSLGPVGNVQIAGGSNNQVLTTNGANGLSWSTKADGSWTDVDGIPIGGIFVGKPYGPSSTVTYVGPGNTFTSNADINYSSFSSILTTVIGNVGALNGIDGYMFAASVNSNVIGRNEPNNITASWTSLAAPLKPWIAPVKGSNNILIFARSSNRAAISSNFGNTWANSTLPNSGFWNDVAYGNGAFVMCTSQPNYPRVAISGSDGQFWIDSPVIGGTINPNFNQIEYGNGVFLTTTLSSPFITYRSSDNGITWSALANTPGPIDSLVYGGDRFVAVRDNTRGAPYNTGAAFFSTDNGATWTQGNISNNRWYGVTYTGSTFVATALGSNVIAYSSDGNNWSYGNINQSGGWVGWDNSKRMLTFSNSSNAIVDTQQATALYVDGSDGTGGANLEVVPNGTYINLGGVGGNTGALWSRVT